MPYRRRRSYDNPTGRAPTVSLDRGALDRIAGRLGSPGKAVTPRRMDFLRSPAAVADQKSCRVGRTAPGAGDIGADRGDPVHHPLTLQKLERPIDGWRFGSLAISAKPGDQVIGLDRFTRAQEQLQDPPPRPGHPLAILQAPPLGSKEGPVDLGGALAVVCVIVCTMRTHTTQLVGEPGPRNRRDDTAAAHEPRSS